MKTQEFLREIPELVRTQLPVDLQDFHTVGPMGSLMKVHYGTPAVHYEVWLHRRRKAVELGLHFESDAATNSRYLKGLQARMDEIRERLGVSVKAERWDRSWTRVHESLPLEPLEEEFLMEVSARLTGMISLLEPMQRRLADNDT